LAIAMLMFSSPSYEFELITPWVVPIAGAEAGPSVIRSI
jgi:hypothetical protein